MIKILSDKNSNPALVKTYFSTLYFVDVSLEFYTYSQNDALIELNTQPFKRSRMIKFECVVKDLPQCEKEIVFKWTLDRHFILIRLA